MNEDHRQTWGLIIDVLDVLEKHGYRRGDDQHTGRAVGLVGDLARIYEGTQEAPAGAYLVECPNPARPARTRPGRQPARTRRRSPPPGCPPSCPRSMRPPTTSGTGRRAAPTARTSPAEPASTASTRPSAYDSLATRLQHAIDADTPDKTSRQATAGPPGNRAQPEAAAEREAGQ